jgi:hypothetical protein
VTDAFIEIEMMYELESAIGRILVFQGVNNATCQIAFGDFRDRQHM